MGFHLMGDLTISYCDICGCELTRELLGFDAVLYCRKCDIIWSAKEGLTLHIGATDPIV